MTSTPGKSRDEAIRRYNDHIETCNRIDRSGTGPLGQGRIGDRSPNSNALREELADTREENRSLRNELAKKAKEVGGRDDRSPSKRPAVKVQTESALAQYRARINCAGEAAARGTEKEPTGEGNFRR